MYRVQWTPHWAKPATHVRPQGDRIKALNQENYWYFDNVVLFNRPYVQLEWIRRILERPVRTQVQRNGRVRHWGFVPEFGSYFRVVTLSDRETVNHAFLDRDFSPRRERA